MVSKHSEIQTLMEAERPESTNTPQAKETSTAIAPESSEPASVPAFGWTPYAERINGRFAMIGFVALLVLEFFTRQDFFTWLGF